MGDLDDLASASSKVVTRRHGDSTVRVSGRVRHEVVVKPKSRLLTVVLVLLAVSLTIGIIAAVGVFGLGWMGISAVSHVLVERPKQLDELVRGTTRPGILATAQQIAADFADHEIRANETYKGKVAMVKGTILKMGAERNGDPFVILTERVSCQFQVAESKTLAGINEGNEITFLGIVDGRNSQGYVEMAHCIVAP